MLIEPEDDGDEHFADAPEGQEKHVEAESSKTAQNNKAYDGRKREPQYANADTSCLWELVRVLVSHLSLSENSLASTHDPLPPLCVSTSYSAPPVSIYLWIIRYRPQHPRLVLGPLRLPKSKEDIAAERSKCDAAGRRGG